MIFRPIVPLLDYAINYEYISKVLCVNKDAPEKKCNGKCHLKKKLNGVFEEGKSSSSEKSVKLVEIELIYFEHYSPIDFTAFDFKIKKNIFSVYSNLYAFEWHKDFFHPPTTSLV